MQASVKIACADNAKLIAVLILLLFSFAGGVAAKGPVSGTINGPGIDGPIELVEHDNLKLLTKLMEQTGLWYATGDLPQPLPGPPDALGPAYTLTWVNSGPPDKSVAERTIRQFLYLDDQQRLLIHTPEQEALAGWGKGVVGWFEAPAGLWETLEALGVPVSKMSSGNAASLPEEMITVTATEHEPAGILSTLAPGALAVLLGLAAAVVGWLALRTLSRKSIAGKAP